MYVLWFEHRYILQYKRWIFVYEPSQVSRMSFGKTDPLWHLHTQKQGSELRIASALIFERWRTLFRKFFVPFDPLEVLVTTTDRPPVLPLLYSWCRDRCWRYRSGTASFSSPIPNYQERTHQSMNNCLIPRRVIFEDLRNAHPDNPMTAKNNILPVYDSTLHLFSFK
jgi:hypothetical protein